MHSGREPQRPVQPQKHTKTLLITTFPPFDPTKTHKNTAIYYISSLRPCKNTQTLLFTTLRPFDTTKTYKNIAIDDIWPLRPCKNPQNTHLLTTLRPFDHAKNTAIYDTGATISISTMQKHCYLPHRSHNLDITYVHTYIHTYVHAYINTFEFAELLRTLLCTTSPAP